MDLEPLKIDRGPRGPRAGGGRRGVGRWVGWLVLLAVLAGALWVFQKPVRGWIDRLSLPRVDVAEAYAADARSSAAISGTAANGYVVARNRAALSADTPGRIVELNVEEGTVVEQGDVVARLYYDEYEAAAQSALAELEAARAAVRSAEARVEASRATLATREEDVRSSGARADAAALALESAEVQLAFAEKEERRARTLFERGVQNEVLLDAAVNTATQARNAVDVRRADVAARAAELGAAGAAVVQAARDVDATVADVAEAGARVPIHVARHAQALATLDKTYVRAPFDGIVVLKDAEVGEVVSPNSQGGSSRGSVATLVDFASLEVQVELPEESIARVAVDAPALVYLDAYPSTPYAGHVQRVWPTANRQKATIEVRVGFDEPDGKLRPEMGVRVVFDPEGGTEPEGAGAPLTGVIVPGDALQRIDGRDGVFVLERDVARWRAVELGQRQAGLVVVQSGLAEGERVVLSAPADLSDGDRVRTKDGR
jgi:RND family efflux transporter MFP subunit